MRPSGFTGEADYGPVVRAGKLLIAREGKLAATLPLSQLGINDGPTIFETDPSQSCGAGPPLTFARTSARQYLIVQSILVGKGCLPVVHLLDLVALKVVPKVSVDHAYEHRYEVPSPAIFVKRYAVRITDTESLKIGAGTLRIIRGRILDRKSFAAFSQTMTDQETPNVGEIVNLGDVNGYPAMRLSPAHERAWLGMQKPSSRANEDAILYNNYFTWSSKLAQNGRFVEALAAFKRALSYLEDTDLRKRERSDIPRLEQLVRDVQSGKIPVDKAKRLWFEPELDRRGLNILRERFQLRAVDSSYSATIEFDGTRIFQAQ